MGGHEGKRHNPHGTFITSQIFEGIFDPNVEFRLKALFFKRVQQNGKRKSIGWGSSKEKGYLLAGHLPEFKQIRGIRQVQEKNTAEGPWNRKKRMLFRPIINNQAWKTWYKICKIKIRFCNQD
jgi:hypothetical protein